MRVVLDNQQAGVVGGDRLPVIRHGLGRVHAFDDVDAFFEGFLDLFVIETICRAVLETFAID